MGGGRSFNRGPRRIGPLCAVLIILSPCPSLSRSPAVASATAAELPGRREMHPSMPQGGFYRSLVERYRRQDHTALVLLRGMPDEEVSASIAALIASTGANDNGRLLELRGAGVLHTDAALEALKRNQGTDALAHGLWAATLIDAAAELASPKADFERRWYVVAAGLFHAERGQALADVLQARSRQRLPTSGTQAGAHAAMRRGTELEIRAAGEGPVSPTAQRFGRYRGIDGMALRWLDSAAKEYAAAAGADATLDEASLHLGRIRVLQGRFDEAAVVLTPLASAPEPRIRYLALMFLGAVAERQDRFADAETRYREAMGAYAWGQSAALGLSQLLGRAGRDAEARATLDEHLRRTRGLVVEPLWTYLIPPGEFLGLEFDQLRAEVWM